MHDELAAYRALLVETLTPRLVGRSFNREEIADILREALDETTIRWSTFTDDDGLTKIQVLPK